jgi:hypothetical protein
VPVAGAGEAKDIGASVSEAAPAAPAASIDRRETDLGVIVMVQRFHGRMNARRTPSLLDWFG